MYALYQHYGYDRGDIGRLFIAGFGSSMVFGTFIGSMGDKYGRRFAGFIYVAAYVGSCATKHWSDYGVLVLGRVLVRTVAASRGVVRVSGEGPRDAAQFVQGLVTNDVLSLGGGRGGCMYAGMLNAKGRMLHDVFLYRQEDVDRRLGGAEAGVTAAEGAAVQPRPLDFGVARP